MSHQWDERGVTEANYFDATTWGNTVVDRHEYVGLSRMERTASETIGAQFDVTKQQARDMIDRGIVDTPDFHGHKAVVDTSFPSGSWHGYYRQYNANHSLMTFELTFIDSVVEGGGQDEVGRYRIQGIFNPETLKVAFGKTYIRGTGNPHENKGHTVEYRGERNRNPAQGLRGTWHVRLPHYSGDGPFHLWPAMQYWNPNPPQFAPPPPPPPPLASAPEYEGMAPSAPVWPPPPPPYEPVQVPDNTYHISDNEECVVCMDKFIDTVLYPCGHVALCAGCARDLCKRGGPCPICRTDIQQVQIQGRSAA